MTEITKQLSYDVREAYEYGIMEHPITQMEKLGYKVIAGVAQTLYDSWWFTVEEYVEPLPKYLSKIQYDYYYWHGNGIRFVC